MQVSENPLTGGHNFRNVVPQEHSSDWVAVRERLRRGHNVGVRVCRDTRMCPKLARSVQAALYTSRFSQHQRSQLRCAGGGDSKPAATTRTKAGSEKAAHLDFIIYQHCADLVASLPECPQPARVGRVNATFALNRLDDDRASLLPNQAFQAHRVVQVSDFHAWDQGRERLLVFWVRRDAQRSHGPTMEGVRKAHDLDFVAGGVVLCLSRRSGPARLPDLPCNLQRALVRLGPRVREEDLRAAGAAGKGM